MNIPTKTPLNTLCDSSIRRTHEFRAMPNAQLAAEVEKAVAEAVSLTPVADLLEVVIERFNAMPGFDVASANLSLHDLENVGEAITSDRTNFTSALLRLIAKSDPQNMARMKFAFPEAVEAFHKWRSSPLQTQGKSL